MALSFFPRTAVTLRLASLLLVWAAAIIPATAFPQQRTATAGKTPGAPPAAVAPHDEDFTISADQQRQAGTMFYADGNVDILFGNTRLRGDHVEFNRETQKLFARGHVKLDYNTQHIEADDGTYDVRTGTGTFHHVRATFAMQRRPSPTLLVTPNPLYFEAQVADRTGPESYKLHHAWLTVCEPDKPTWEFHAQDVSVEMQRSVRLERGDFRLLSVPVILFPYATFPAGHRRQSGFLIPDFGNSTQKGLFLGEDLYWAPTDWMDTTLGGTYLSKRGWAQNADFRSHPWENARLDASYTGVIDRGLEEPTGPPLKQGGHEIKFDFDALLPDGWRAVAELNQLSSLTYRLAFAETFTQAVNSEVRNTAFLTRDWSGFSLDFAANSYKNFLSATPETSIDLRTAPEARFGSVDQAPFRNLPLYFSFDSFVDAVHRGDTVTPFSSSGFIPRLEFAPSVTMPLHWGLWLNVTPSFTFRATHYGAQLENGSPVNEPFDRNTEEFTLDIRPPALDRIYYRDAVKWKHTIEPDIVYRYVD
ncbi:MAG: LPS assembly protein LptD, partial [Candidatus Acidiferrales bacterium]